MILFSIPFVIGWFGGATALVHEAGIVPGVGVADDGGLGARPGDGYHPGWYRGGAFSAFDLGGFVGGLGGDLGGAVASSSSAPGSSGGGFGGSGGGGGW